MPPALATRLPTSAKQSPDRPIRTAQTTYARTAAGPIKAATSAGKPKIPEPTMLLNEEKASAPTPMTLLSDGAAGAGELFSNTASLRLGFTAATSPRRAVLALVQYEPVALGIFYEEHPADGCFDRPVEYGHLPLFTLISCRIDVLHRECD